MKDWETLEKQMKQEIEVPEPVKRKMQETLKNLPERKRRHWNRTRRLAVAMAVTLLVPVGVYAAGKYILTARAKGNLEMIGLQGESEGEIETAALDIQFGYVPEGFIRSDLLHYSTTGKLSGWENQDGFFAGQFDGYPIEMRYVINKEETMIQGYEAYCYELDPGMTEGYCNYIFMNNPAVAGQMIYLGGMKNVSMEELKKIAEGLKITMKEETVTVSVVNWDDELKWMDEEAKAAAGGYYVDLPAENQVEGMILPGIGTSETFEQKEFGTLEIKEVQITDSVKGMQPEYFLNYEKDVAPFVNADGSLKQIERKTNEYGEKGITQKNEEVGLRLVQVNCVVTNTLDEKMEFWTGSVHLHATRKKENGSYQILNKRYDNHEPLVLEREYPIYFDQAENTETETRNHFFYRVLKPGETLSYTVAYIAYEDELEGLTFILDQDYMGLQRQTYEMNDQTKINAPFLLVQK